MKKVSLETKLSKFFSVFLTFSLFLQAAMFLPVPANAATTIFSDSFGSSDLNDATVNGWTDSDGSGEKVRISTSSSRPGSPTTGHVRLREGESIFRTVDTSGYQNISISYYWRGDSDASNSDYLRVYWKKTFDPTFIEVDSHKINQNTSNWSSLVTVNLPAGADDTSIDIKFVGDSNRSAEEARIDDVNVSGDPVSRKIDLCHYDDEEDEWAIVDVDQNAWDLHQSGHSTHTWDYPYTGGFDPKNDKTEALNWCGEHSQMPRTATVYAQKVVCSSEADLPNWGDNDPAVNIGSTTASDYVSQHPNCHLDQWTFEWAPGWAGNPGDNIGTAGGLWVPFTGSVDITPTSTIWVREQANNNYIPFTGDANSSDGWSDVSAEMYCNDDVLNYDNYEWINNLTAGQKYYCVGFNVLKTPEPVCDPKVNLVANGGFEEPVVTNPAMWDVFNSGTPGLSWLVNWVDPAGAPTIASLELQRGVKGWLPSEGKQYTELDGDWGGPSSSQSTMISQNIQTIPGKTYKLSFDFSPRPDQNASENILGIFWGGEEASSSPVSAAGNGSQTSWTPYTFDFVATSSVTTLMFKDEGPSDSLGTFLDNVSLACQNEPVCDKTNVTQTIVSDPTTQSNGHDSVAVATPYHPAWTTDISGASWIWGEDLSTIDLTVDRIEVFTKTFEISGVPTGATLDLATDNGYILKVNGNLIEDRFAEEHNYETPNIHHYTITADKLHTGTNYLEVTIKNFKMEGGNVSTNPAGLLYKLVVSEDQCQEPPVCTATNVEQTVVSDDSNIVNTTAFAVPTYTHPLWTSLSGATWIWDTPEVVDPSVEQTDMFTKTFVVDGAVLSAGIDIASDNGYKLEINGILIDDKLAVENNFSAVTHYDLTGIVHSGTNVIEATVKNLALGTDPHANPAGLLYKLTLHKNECTTEDGDGGGGEIGTSRIHIVKYIDSAKATENTAKSQEFSIEVAGTWAGNLILNSGNSYESDINHDYQNDKNNNADIQEDTTDSNVIAYGGQCTAGKFRVVGYTMGNSLSDALNSSATTTDKASIVNIQENKYVVTWNETCPDLSTVTMCKVDQNDKSLSNWTMMLLGPKVETVNVLPNGSDYSTVNPLNPGNYVLLANGAYVYRPSDVTASTSDAAYSLRLPSDSVYGGPYVPWVRENDFPSPYTGWLGIQVNDSLTDWGSIFNPLHVYAHATSTGITGPLSFRILDDQYGDNSGSLNVDVYPGYAGLTGGNGCVTFSNVPYGDYTADEIMQNGWNIVSGNGSVVVNDPTETFTIKNTNAEGPIVCASSLEVGCGLPEGPTAVCSNGLDDDGDGLIDMNDPGCTDPQDNDEANQIRLFTFSSSNDSNGSSLSGGRRHNTSGGGEVLGASTCEPYLLEYIKLGANNNSDEVKKLQEFLNEYMDAGLPVSGFYGQLTYNWVKKFQALHSSTVLLPWTQAGLQTDDPTGYVYKTTKRWINILKCPDTITSNPIPSLP